MPDCRIVDNSNSPHAALRTLDLRAVRWTEGFWRRHLDQCRQITVPHLYKLMADPDWGHALTNLRIAAGVEEGEHAGTHWQDAWVYKWLECAATCHALSPDEGLDQQMDEVIDIIARAQADDGYLATQTMVRGWQRYQDPHHHELYVMGHLMTAACIHHRATGKDSLLAVARRAADHVWETFKDGDPELAHFPINPSIIMGAVELYRATGERRYLDLANTIIDMRGSAPRGCDLNQTRVPLRDEQEVVGHGVFFTYLFAGAADAFMETGDRALREALERLWRDLAEKKTYVHGGVCPIHRGLTRRVKVHAGEMHDVHEAAGHPYELPNSTAYNETCAQVGSVMWNWRMLLIDPQPRYADMMERQMYNSILSGVGIEGASWFYTNPLRWHGAEHRLLSNDAHQRFQPGAPERRRAHICCPTNLTRAVLQWGSCQYSTSADELWLHHFAAGELRAEPWRITMETDYPWDGEILLQVRSAPPQETAIHLRIPEWAQGAQVELGEAAFEALPGTYFEVRRAFAGGNTVRVHLPMPVTLIEAHPRIEATLNQVAVMRGPIIYCLESPDLPPEVHVDEIRLPREARFDVCHDPHLLGGVTVLECDAWRLSRGDWEGRLYRPLPSTPAERIRIRLIPYFAWANRGLAEMSIWLPLWH